jgi:hypothetical protein
VSVRTPKDFALEFGEYMAKAADNYLFASDEPRTEDDYNAKNEAYTALRSAVYEFRKRADRAKAMLSASPQAKGEGDG